MKTIGLIGGLSWESSAEYYRQINQEVHHRLGGHHSARLVLVSVDFDEVEVLQHQNRWDEATAIMVQAARRVEQGGGECLLICSNTMHRMAADVAAAVSIPVLHIADATGQAIAADGRKAVGLLGTRFTMEQEFYREQLASRYGLEVIIPPESERGVVHNIIFDELVYGDFRSPSKGAVLDIMDRLSARGAEGIVLGCTELPLLIKPEDTPLPLYDTLALHVAMAVNWALEGPA